ncbi:MAG: acyl--CoA ligase [Clostridia bacterium]|nr:acyl--CoA ligase [Clostridia bacterium]
MIYQSDAHVFDKYADPKYLDRIVDYENVTQMWKNSVKTYPSNVALVDGRQITYTELDEEVSRFRSVLLKKGVTAGDKVGVFAPNSIEFAKAFLAITTLGAVAVLLPPHLPAEAVFGCSTKYGMKALVYHKALEEKVVLVREKSPVKLVSAEETAEEGAPMVEVKGEAPCAVVFTGGTTGKNKGALLSQQAIMRGTKNGCYGVKGVFEQRYFLVLPLTHVFGLIRNLLTSLYTGSTLYICRDNKNMFREIAVFKPTSIILVPALAELALNLSKQFKKNMLGEDLKTIVCGAAAVPPYLIREYKKLGIDLHPGYGLTESANLVSGNPEPMNKPDSVGFLYPGIQCRVVDGELWLKGINMQDCYYGEQEENDAAYSDGWFRTGDLVRFDEDGSLYITGRIKEVIVLSTGEKISPAEVEVKFDALDIVQDCLIYKSEEGGREILVLEVLPRASELAKVQTDDKEKYLRDQINAVNKTLPAFSRVSKIVVRDTDFARSPSMKILRDKNGTDKK